MAHAATTSCQRSSKSGSLVVAAIEFGTTYSGYAFSLAPQYKEDPMIVHFPRLWFAGSAGLMTLKTPTVLLLNPDLSFNSFGYEAEDAFTELVLDNEHRDYRYFRRFTMMLYSFGGRLRRDMMLEDSNRHRVKAMTVFAMSIKYFKEHLMDTLKNRMNLTEEDVHWILTVPGIWNDGSKQFMREAAEMAGIKGNNLDIALEPEAASLYCMHLPVDKMEMQGSMSESMRAAPLSKGTKFMVLDVGGCTVNITLHEVVDVGKLKELDHAIGGEWGGTCVDASFEEFLRTIVGLDSFDKFKRDYPDDYIFLYRELERKKTTVQIRKAGKETIKVPITLIETYEEDMKKKGKAIKLSERISQIKEFDGKVAVRGDRIRLDNEIVKSWFDQSCKKILQCVKKVFEGKNCKDVKTILLVGGFSESQMVQEALKSTLSDKQLIIPAEAGLAVLKGAVLYGHNPLTIVSRVAKWSYGICVYRDFNPDLHPESKKEKVGKRYKCKHVFEAHITRGQELVIGETQSEKRCTPLETEQYSLVFDIYRSFVKEPLFVTDFDCTYIGQLEVEIPETTDENNGGVVVSMKFGDNGISVEGKVEKTGKVTKASFDFLQ